MNCHLLSIIFPLALGFGQLSGQEFDEKLLTSDNLTNAQLEQVCGKSYFSESRIVGGEKAEPGEFPWMAKLYPIENDTIWDDCGGSVITNWHILTAAHCLYLKDTMNTYKEVKKVVVKLGSIDVLSGNAKTYETKNWTIHEKYDPSEKFHDIALIMLDQKIKFSKWIAPICLHEDSCLIKSNYVDENVVAAGWGRVTAGGKQSLGLRQVTLKVLSFWKCRKVYKRQFTITNICAGFLSDSRDTCQGDSGGPLMLEFKNKVFVIGITSYGNRCGDPAEPGVYTRVSTYLDWIKQNAEMTDNP